MSLPDDRLDVGGPRTSGGQPLGALIDEAHHAPPDELASLVARCGAAIGAQEVVIYLIGYEQRMLTPLPGEGVPARERIGVDHALGGRAYRTLSTMRGDADGGQRLWVPLLDGTARLGVLEVTVPVADDATLSRVRQLAGLVAALVVTKDLYGDAFKIARRVEHMTVAAEMQWELLPPPTFSDGRVTVSGILEPSYRVAGDTFDYAMNGDRLHLAVIDAMGHGFEATVMATVATGVYRHARRLGHDLPEMYAAIDDAIVRQFGLDRFHRAADRARHPHRPAAVAERRAPCAAAGAGHHPRRSPAVRADPAPGLRRCGGRDRRTAAGAGGPVALRHRRGPGGPVGRRRVLRRGAAGRLLRACDHRGDERPRDRSAAGISSPRPPGGSTQDDATTIFVQWHGRKRPALPPLLGSG